MEHNKIYLVYSLFIFLVGMGFFTAGEFNRPPKPELKDPNLLGHEDEENGEQEGPGTAEISGEDIQMPVPEPEEPTIEDIALETDEEDAAEEEAESEEQAEGEEEEAGPPLYDGHEEERIELIKENYIAQEKYDSSRWTTYVGFMFWALSIVCAILYFRS
ncbi:hypothetical protein SAMN04487770_105148 [Butyrivibrio sp. ob235]|uniref:hypothetical protein n=1 Tax=Butyrivibrio sp. ob235 TaxID=1761780 RepID=UPI0008B7EEC8|nr:hypothetical protein [Butyrivibrio sp. ob235]SEL06931.1 hypothetical protein SAMN04487770_105148 [Butyrivibrio sp. ob235]